MLPAEEIADPKRTAMNNATVRSVFLIDEEKNSYDVNVSNDDW